VTRPRSGRAAAAALALAIGSGAAGPPAGPDALWRHRNLGKAFYENPTTHAEAVAELKQALDLAPGSVPDRVNYGLALLRAGRTEAAVAELERAQREDPSIPHTWFNLGIVFKKQGEYDRALAQFEGMAERAPGDAVSRYNLGYLYQMTGKREKALAEFERAAGLAPNFAAPRFQLYNAYRLATPPRTADADRALARFQEIKRQQAGAAVPEDVDWSVYAELVDVPDPANAREPAAAPPAPLAFEVRPLAAVGSGAAGLAVIDADGDRQPDLLAWSTAGLALFRKGAEAVPDAAPALPGVRAVAIGDWDDDGRPDLCVVAGEGATLLRNAGGRFVAAPASLPPGPYATAVWIDYDHDYDLDLLLLGERSALVRNNGRAGFGDASADFPFVPGRATSAVLLDVTAEGRGQDVLVTYADHAAVLYRDRLGGLYEAEPLDEIPGGAQVLAAEDVDYDGATDVIGTGPGGLTLWRNRNGRFEPLALGVATAAVALADFENRAASDVASAAGILRNEGAGRFALPSVSPLPGAVGLAAADFDGDGRVDLAAVGADGRLRVARNTSSAPNRWMGVAVEGVKNLKLAPGARVEVKAGARYQKKRYDGVPLHFGLRGFAEADTVRITWPNGLVQNEMRQGAGSVLVFKERPRLSGSCPMIFGWNGSRFAFVTDVLGVAPLGASAGDGAFFPVDHDEYVQIPGSALAVRDGGYEVHITEELREVSYLDLVELVAVDHPAGLDIVTNEKFKSPPFPEFRLFGVSRRIPPARALDDRGADVRERLIARDRRYPDGFRRTMGGVAEPHHLDLDFGGAAPDGRAVLVLTGWVDWADGSTFRGAAQEDPRGLVLPYLQTRDGQGRWQTVIEDMGMPAGKPKTIAVDLTGHFLSSSREVRIVTNLALYWDEIFLTEDVDPPPVRLTHVSPDAADLHFRGFSTPTIDPARAQPEAFDYDRVLPVSMWNPTPGLYTRYGDVRALLDGVDDRFVIMGSGDELRLRFPAAALPALPSGGRRDFLLLVDGWAKDADFNTAYSQSVEPLPFHAMSRYPYPPSEAYPDDAAHREYRERYNRRPARRLLRPLAQAGPLP